MSKPTLTLDDFSLCKEVLSRHSRVREALVEISEKTGKEVTRSKLEKLFAKKNVLASDFLKVPAYQGSPVTKEESDEVGLSNRLRYTKKLERMLANRDYLGSLLSDAVKEAFRECPIVLSKKPKLEVDKTAKPRLLTALVSDWHFGLIVNPQEVAGNQYDWTIAARRLAYYATQIASWKPEHRKSTKLNLIFGGDLIAGVVHMDDAGVRPLAEQIAGATSLLVQFIDYLRHHFAEIQITCVPGNHERILKTDYHYAQRWNSHATSIYLGVAMAFRDDPTVQIQVPKTGEAVIELPSNELLFFSHGDIQPTISSVGNTLDIRPITNLVKTLNSSGEFTKPVRVFCVGHWHSGSIFTVGHTTAIVNGSGIGPDAYAKGAVNIRGHYGEPAQVVFESVPEHSFGDSRFIRLSVADMNAELDKIITAPGF